MLHLEVMRKEVVRISLTSTGMFPQLRPTTGLKGPQLDPRLGSRALKLRAPKTGLMKVQAESLRSG